MRPLATYACLLTCGLAASLFAAQDDAGATKWGIPFIKGYSWGWTGVRGEYEGRPPEKSLKLLAETGTEWIALAFAAEVQTKHSSEILYAATNDWMVTDAEIRRAIDLARQRRLKIMLKPVVNCRDGSWRATINFETEQEWDEWWRNYERFLLHYAQIAAETKCEMFCVGCEMRSTERFGDRWRWLIEAVRRAYDGPIVYNSNHDDFDRIEWFDSVDVVGISAYWPVTNGEDTSLEAMLAGWRPFRDRLCSFAARTKKPILFAEIGMRSAKTCSSMPWDWNHQELPYDGEEQARYYEAAFRTFWAEPWFLGYFWWDWKARLYEPEQAESNTDFCAFGKPAKKVLQHWYSQPCQRVATIERRAPVTSTQAQPY